ncbi:Ig-like domain-containing protein [Enterovibrio baiacu]|uniref:Ig-like domain-containing protein n=1 Tax=Enterovibrio baiacu TaxID=2491023 RepID=UPI0010136AB0|nr:Ig-like domain-containing protein [Enterovibrio baiacu]MBE1273884.1 hypothetical protein [Enterovibrio baiacu]
MKDIEYGCRVGALRAWVKNTWLRCWWVVAISLLLAGCNPTWIHYSSNQTSPSSDAPSAIVLTVSDNGDQASTLNTGDEITLSVSAEYSNSASQNITSEAEFSSSDATVAKVEGDKLIAVSPGSAVITCFYDGITSNVLTITVSAPYVTQLSLSPTSTSVALGRNTTFTATATYSDNSTADASNLVNWQSSNVAVSTISLGVSTTLSTGTTTISAEYDGITSNDATLTVSAAELDSIAITPTTSSIAFNATQAYTANGTYSDGNVINISSSVSWQSSDTGVASFSSNTATGDAAGSSSISATLNAVTSNTSSLSVSTFPLCGGAVNDSDGSNATGACIKVVDYLSTGMLFTGTPSESAILALGYSRSVNNSNTGQTYDSIVSDSYISGNVATFRKAGNGWNNDIASPTYGQGGQLDRYCENLSNIRFNQRQNWRVPSLTELDNLYANQGSMQSYGWPVSLRYGSSTGFSSNAYYLHSLRQDSQTAFSIAYDGYASCVSDP